MVSEADVVAGSVRTVASVEVSSVWYSKLDRRGVTVVQIQLLYTDMNMILRLDISRS